MMLIKKASSQSAQIVFFVIGKSFTMISPFILTALLTMLIFITSHHPALPIQ